MNGTEVLRLRMTDIRKRFGSTQALAGVSLEVGAGEVHAIVGENGAGKSTLMKILSGAEEPDAGRMLVDGEPYRPAGPQQARRAGVAMVYQELALAPHLSVAANVMLGLEQHRWGFLRERLHRKKVEAALAMLDHPEIQPDTPVHDLSPGAKQLVEVARALVVDARIIVFDEPTSSLTHHDAEHLFELIGRLKRRGVSVLYISHFLEEVQRVADRYTVLRDGRNVASGDVAATPVDRIVQQMVGRSVAELFPRIPHQPGEAILEVGELRGEHLPRDVRFTLRRGEILGVFGLIGAGRTEMVRTLFGLDAARRFVVRYRGRPLRPPTARSMIDAGFGFLSENRKEEGLALVRSIEDNVTYSRLEPYLIGPFLDLRRRRRVVVQYLERLAVRYRDPAQSVFELSGGNQQKVAFARLLHQQADVLLLDEPTRGVDMAGKVEIYRLMGELAAQGKAIVFVSSYLPELLGICDTLAVMVRGKLLPPRRVSAWTEEEIMRLATGG